MITIAQITDLHIASDGEKRAHNESRLREALESIHALKPRPLAILATGDLTDHGFPEEYEELKQILRRAEIPVHFGIGNHDNRANFREAFFQTPVDEHGFVQYAFDIDALRIVMCDTMESGREGGAFCERRASWLEQALSAAPDKPTIVAFHHPPIVSGISWMDPDPDAEWISRLAAALKRQMQVKALICGHVHRAFHGIFAGHLLCASPATAPQLTLDMTPADRSIPDGREIVRDEPPGFSLYRWDRNSLSAHTCVAGAFAPVAFFEQAFALE